MTDRIFTETDSVWVTLSVHTETGISSLDLAPSDAYSIAQYIEWLTEPPLESGLRRPEPSLLCPAGTGVWGEFKPGSKQASFVHIAVIGDTDESEFGRTIVLSPPVAAILANKLIANAADASVAVFEEEEEE
jgi:hypothetical protein